MVHRRMVLPDDVRITEVYGSDGCGKRRLRLRRAEKRGLLPRRVYLSAARFGYWSDELEAALTRLPSNYTATLPQQGAA